MTEGSEEVPGVPWGSLWAGVEGRDGFPECLGTGSTFLSCQERGAGGGRAVGRPLTPEKGRSQGHRPDLVPASPCCCTRLFPRPGQALVSRKLGQLQASYWQEVGAICTLTLLRVRLSNFATVLGWGRLALG